jgi:hypothetical protein
VVLTKKHQPLIKQRVIDWEQCETMGDWNMIKPLTACEAHGMKDIMTMQCNWNNEVIA